MIDLHCHSHFSDGELSPAALLNKAVSLHVRLLALTDHDTTEGLLSLHQAACDADITIIDGVELSVRWKKYDLHVIGLRINPDHPSLRALIAVQTQRRIDRAKQIALQLVDAGVQEAYSKACAVAGHERVVRTHFATVLIQEGRAVDMKHAFKRFLGQGCVGYVQTDWVGLSEAVSTIVESGGQAVIAHPLKYGLTRTKLHALILAFKEAGGAGIEVVSGTMTDAQAQELAGLCHRYQLLASTGSDFHGDLLSYTGLGQQRPLPVNCTPIWNQWTS